MEFKKLEVPQVEKRFFTCPKHGKYEADCLVSTDGNIYPAACPECRRIAEQAERNEKRTRLEKMWAAHNIEPEYFLKTFSDFTPKTESQAKALESVKAMVSRRNGKVVLLGPNGVGKTMLASIAAKELGGYIFTVFEISAIIRQAFTNTAVKSELEILNDFSSVPFLAIDELGRSKCGDAEQNWLSHIIDKRHAKNLPLMIMGNVHFKRFCPQHGCPKCFESILDNDALSRLHQNSAVIKVDAPDARLESLGGMLR